MGLIFARGEVRHGPKIRFVCVVCALISALYHKRQICGIVSAKHLGAENVNYAIKAKYLKEFLERKNLPHLISEGEADVKHCERI